MHYELHLPFPPTDNNYYVKTRQGQFISLKGKKFRAEVAAEVESQLSGLARLPLDYPVQCDIIVYVPDKRRRDIMNYMKALADAMTQAGVWTDDSLIDQSHIYRGAVTYGGKIVVVIREAGPVIPLQFDLAMLG